MADARIGIGIIGCGNISRTHIEALGRIPEARLVAVSDVIPEKARAAGEKHGVPWFSDNEELLKRNDVQAVGICTPSGLHADLGILTARAGKHVLVEKPIDIHVEKADALIAACKKAGVKLTVISQFRFHPNMKTIRETAASGKLGRLTLGICSTKWYRGLEYFATSWRGTWEMDGGGCCMNQGVHAVDQMLTVMGPAKRVIGYVDTLAQKIQTEDVAAGTVEFASGALGVIEASTVASPGMPQKLEVMGDAGTLVWEMNSPVFKTWELKDGTQAPAPVNGSFGHWAQYRDFLAAILENREPMSDGPGGRRAIELITSLYRSSRERRAIKLA